jgi:hypothetical protein
MNRSIFNRIRERLTPRLNTTTGVGRLDEEALTEIHALFQVLTAEQGLSRERCRAVVDQRTARPGYLRAYRSGVRLLRAAALLVGRRTSFAALDERQRELALRLLMRRYPHRSREPRWRRRLRITGSHLDPVLTPSMLLAFREFVARDLLAAYYSGPEGWATVGYDEYPGRVRIEWEPCQVVAVHDEGDHLLLELSDATFEPLIPERLEADEEHELAVITKSGRQRATFSRDAHFAIARHLTHTDEAGWVLVHDGRRHEVLRDPAG